MLKLHCTIPPSMTTTVALSHILPRNSAELTGLKPYTSYRVTVVGVTGGGKGDESGHEEARTLGDGESAT